MIFNITFGYMELLERFLHYIGENNLCDPQRDRILLAVSGGRDSVLLMHLFVNAGFDIGIAHCNFTLREAESDADEDLVRDHAQTLGVPSFFKRFETEKYAHRHGISIQMAARELRYEWFETIREQAGFDYVAVAHHANDNVETLLINLLRGTGLRGLQGMSPKRDRIIRPLLFLTYDEVTTAVGHYGLRYRDDSSNFSTDYSRNKIRLEVIPKMKEINPGLEETFAQNMDIIRDVHIFVDRQIAMCRDAVFRPAGGETVEFDLAAVKSMEPLGFVLYELLQPFHFMAPVCMDLADVLRRDPPVAGRQFGSATHTLWVDRDKGLIRAHASPSAIENLSTVELDAKSPITVWEGQRLEIVRHPLGEYHTEEHANNSFASFDADHIPLPLQVRAWRRGDTFRPSGMNGRSKKLSDFFVSKKVPLWEKFRIPVVTDANGVIVWVAPLRMSTDYNISRETKNVLTISYFCEDGR